jgi:transketolase
MGASPHQLSEIARRIRYLILMATTEAESGHPTSSLSAADLMAALFFSGFFRYDSRDPGNPANDRLIFSKGHATPLFYALWAAAGQLSEEDLRTYRKFGSPLEGHPTANFRLTEAATGSLGQGLSIGVGMAINAKYLDRLPYRTFVLLGDSEMTEGSQWEAIQIAAHSRLDNLVGVLDVNRWGQRGETMYGHDVEAYAERIRPFGWNTLTIDGHDFEQIVPAFEAAMHGEGRPTMIIARTIKGKGVSWVEDRNGYHGKPFTREDFERAVAELGEVDHAAGGELPLPPAAPLRAVEVATAAPPSYRKGDSVATRAAYGKALNRISAQFPDLVSIDAEVGNSTGAEAFKQEHPDRFFEMYITEQNMVGVALGLAQRGKIPFASTFAAFLTRAFDQIRMSQYSRANIKFVGSHSGVTVGEDGPSQMGLEDLAMFRTLFDSVVLYPSDAVSTDRLVEAAAAHQGIVYLRTSRNPYPVLYDAEDEFRIGGSRLLLDGDAEATVIAAGVTVHEAMCAAERLRSEGIRIRVLDLYSVKPVDAEALRRAARETRHLITVEDHVPAGGIADAVREILSPDGVAVYSLAVTKPPRSGKAEELLRYEGIDAEAIARMVGFLASRGRQKGGNRRPRRGRRGEGAGVTT